MFEMFEESELSKGIYHWSDRRLFEQVKRFMENFLSGFSNPTDYEVWACALLIYPAKGIEGACQPLCQVLGEDGIRVFRDIFANNNATMVAEFFTNPIIKKLWPQVAR
jgi:hypothetical protein